MNSRALSLGIGLIFTIDIVFTLVHYTQGLPLRTTAIVITQCAIIVIFYLLVWKMEPFSTTYVKKVEQAKSHLHRRNLPPRFVTAVFLFGFMLAIFLFLTTIIYLPGVTLNAFLNQSELTRTRAPLQPPCHPCLQPVFHHPVHPRHHQPERWQSGSLTSRKIPSAICWMQRSRPLPAIPVPDQNPLETGSLLLESKIFIVKRNTLAGAFPVFVVDLDFSVLMDTTTLTAIKGYIVEKQ